jgi:hypothetical protein
MIQHSSTYRLLKALQDAKSNELTKKQQKGVLQKTASLKLRLVQKEKSA